MCKDKHANRIELENSNKTDLSEFMELRHILKNLNAVLRKYYLYLLQSKNTDAYHVTQ